MEQHAIILSSNPTTRCLITPQTSPVKAWELVNKPKHLSSLLTMFNMCCLGSDQNTVGLLPSLSHIATTTFVFNTLCRNCGIWSCHSRMGLYLEAVCRDICQKVQHEP